jgi:hypothetical protein
MKDEYKIAIIFLVMGIVIGVNLNIVDYRMGYEKGINENIDSGCMRYDNSTVYYVPERPETPVIDKEGNKP